MVKKSKARPVKRRRVKRKPKPGKFYCWCRKVFFISLGILSFLFIVYLGYLDYTVSHQFAGKRWAMPAKVYASPVELYSGHEMSAAKLENLLQQLHYRHDYRLTSEGSYHRKGSTINIKTRHFTFWDQQQSSSLVRIKFTPSTVARIIDLQRSTEVAILRLDPVKIGSFYPTRKEDRILIKLEQTPDTLIQGLLATEDRNFYQHHGLSPRAIARAAWVNLKAGGVVQGGSTITQQLVKNFYLTPERSLVRKVNEALMSLILEFRFSKDEILEAYLNEVYLGQDGASAVHGFGLASQFYFGRTLQSLPLHQVATLVALVRGPSYYDPRRQPKRATKRRNLVLDEMQKQGYISLNEAASAKRQALGVTVYKHYAVNRYPAFLDLVRRQLRTEYREQDLTSEGLRIFTTLDTEVQDILQKVAEKKLKQLERRPKTSQLETAAVVTRRNVGEIVAVIGGRNSKNTGFNRALDALRSVGSLIKPAVYLSALEASDKYTITTAISDREIKVKSKNGKTWAPRNYGRIEHGDVALHTALAHSYNLATVRIGMDIGIAKTAKTLRNLGVTRSVKLYPSLLLGASPLTPIEVTQMYQTLAGDGFATPLRAIRAVISSTDELLQRYPFSVRQTVDPAATFITNTILQEAMHEGTGRSAYRYLPTELNVVGKTGTTNDLRDSWFAGFTGDYLSVVWVGRDDNKSTGLTGASGALQLWTALMKQVARQPVALIAPDNVQMYWVDPQNGMLADQSCQGAVLYPYIAGSAPSERSKCMNTPLNQAKQWFNNLMEEGFE
jgi:penicillin-binding protein 1B